MKARFQPLTIFATFLVALWISITWQQTPKHANLLTSNTVKQIQHYDESVQAEFNSLWQGFDDLLTSAKPPSPSGPKIANFVGLRKPASLKAIAEFEQKLGHRIPAELKASMLIHDGCEGEFFSFYRLYSVKKISETWESMLGISVRNTHSEIYPNPEFCKTFWHPGWIPVAGANGAEWIVFLNLENGKIYQCISPYQTSLVADSWKEWLTVASNRFAKGEFELKQYSANGKWSWESQTRHSTPSTTK